MPSPRPPLQTQAPIAPDAIRAAVSELEAQQPLNQATRAVHAAAWCGRDGTIVLVREDVGRHNAVDKVVGWALREGMLPLTGHLLMVSGRASFELTQKAAMAGIPLLAAVSAPSSLAVDLAQELGLTLVGFLRGHSANVYAGTERVALP